MSLNAFSKYGRFAVSLPVLVGKTFFVSSDSAVINRMRSMFPPDEEGNIRVFATLDAAVNACTANRGDKILIGEGHTETLSTAAAIALDVAGIEVIGMGNGADRPQFTFDTITGASMTVSAASIKVKNIIGVAGLDGLTLPFHVTGDDCELDLEWRDASATVEAETAVRLDTANNCKLNLVYKGFTAGNAVVRAVAIDDCDNVDVNIDAYGVVSTAWVNMVDVASTNVKVRGRMYTQGITAFTRDVVDTVGGSTWDADLWDSSFGGHISGGSAAALASDDVSAIATVLGTPVNTGGTATISAILGDPANTSLSSRIDTLKQELSGTGIAVFPVGATPGNGVSVAAVIRSTHTLATNIDQNLSGLTGVAVWAPGAAAANGVSISESLRYAQEGIRQDGGTAMAATKSVADALGSDGATVTDSAVSVLGAIGADNNNNAFASTNVVANVDGSVLERLEAIQQHVGATDSTTNILGANDADNGFDSSAVVANANGSIIERIEYVQGFEGTLNTINANTGDIAGLSLGFTCGGAMVASTTNLVTTTFDTYGDDFFNNKYYVQIVKNSNAPGTAPENEIRKITDWTDGTGTFVTDAFSVNVEASDQFIVLHESLIATGRDDANNTFATTNVVANVDGSVLERLEDLKDRVDTVDNLIDTEVAAIQADIGDPSARANFSSLETMIGVPDAVNSNLDDMLRTGFDSTAVAANIDGSVMERLEDIVVKVTAVDDLVDTEVAAIQTDIGDPSARTNLQSLTAMLGNPDTAGETIYAASGTEFVVKKTLTSSAIVQASVDITGLSSGGDLLIKDIYMNTDATGLATGTDFKIETNNVNGVAVIYEETVANLGANATEALSNGSVAAVSGSVLESGKKLLCRSTVADCTGAGTITICVLFQRVAGGATVAAA